MSKPSLSHRLEYAAYRGLERAAGRLSMDSCAAFGRTLGELFHFFSRRYRRLVRRNLRIATADAPLGDRELDRLVRETFRRAGTNFLCSLRSAPLSPAELAKSTRIEPDGLLERSTASDRGLVVALPHMGNWEVLAKLGTLHVPPGKLGAVYRPLNNPLMDELTLQRRTADGARLFSRKAGIHAATTLLREHGVLAILSDQRAGSRGVALPFFGKLTTCPPLPRLLARRAKAAVATMANLSGPDGSWTVQLETVDGPPDLEPILASLESQMRRSLADVFWFHDRWRINSHGPLSLFTPIDPAVAATARVPLRIVVTLPDPGDEHAAAFLDRLIALRPDLRIELLSPEKTDFDDPRIIVHDWDPQRPAEQQDGVLARLDDSHPVPLDAALLLGGTPGLARSARRFGLRSIIGLGVRGKPWHRSFDPPRDRAAWLAIAEALAASPPRRSR